MHHYLDQNFAQLKQIILTMASYAETLVSKAVRALVERNDDLAHQVLEQDRSLDAGEVELDEAAINLLLKGLVASDLRSIIVSMKLSQNLERVGDEATKIARRALELNKEPPLKAYVDIPLLAKLVSESVRQAMDSFVEGDLETARKVIQQDKQIDDINRRLNQELVGFMLESPGNITRCLNLITICRSLERIGDHATNVAEEVIFLNEGRDIRHQIKSLPRQSLLTA